MVYQTPTRNDFQRNLAAMLKQTRETAHTDSQRIRAEHAARGLGQSGPLISAVAERFDKLHAETIETMMRLIGDFVARTRISPKEFADTVRPVLETIRRGVGRAGSASGERNFESGNRAGSRSIPGHVRRTAGWGTSRYRDRICQRSKHDHASQRCGSASGYSSAAIRRATRAKLGRFSAGPERVARGTDHRGQYLRPASRCRSY
jgi:hypothetical protein